MCNIRWHVIITSISVVDLLIGSIIGEIVVKTSWNIFQKGLKLGCYLFFI